MIVLLDKNAMTMPAIQRYIQTLPSSVTKLTTEGGSQNTIQ